MKIVLFSGGRGSSKISQSLAVRPDIELTIVVNAYDDGLSTGLMRRKFKGMLGPSDIRKNFSHLLEIQGQDGQELAHLLEYRIDSQSDELTSYDDDFLSKLNSFLNKHTQRISRRASDDLIRWMDVSLSHLAAQSDFDSWKQLQDVALGNLILSGAFLDANSNFNAAIKMWSESFNLHRAKILNVTDGQNLVLVGTKADGTFLPDEASIVDVQSHVPIDRVFLLRDYMSESERQSIDNLSQAEVFSYLQSKHTIPEMNPDVEEAITHCDLIVYGPGTQHSSLFPSYMTSGVADVISSRKEIEKVFISNISEDHDIQSETINSLLEKLADYMNLGAKEVRPVSSYVSQCFLSTSGNSLTPWGIEKFDRSSHGVGYHIGQWTSDGKKHDGQRVANGLVSLGRHALMPQEDSRYTTISVVIPVLNEFERLPIVLEKLITFDWLAHNLIPEFIVVDGGSDDGSAELIREFPIVRSISLKAGTGRGEALRTGIQNATSQIIVTFPSDDEYEVSSIADVASLLRSTRVPIVFGSRIGLCADTDARLRKIYGGRNRTYYMSKWGGFTLSVLSGFLYKRWIADTLTSVKGFSSNSIERLSMKGKSADWDVRIIMDASREEFAIAEVPVEFRPRRLEQGKKIRPVHGIQAMTMMISGVWRSR
jgi:2-phospho-L-lactate transferase/gluconeogenesis factor (CofD/UPF0052 family)